MSKIREEMPLLAKHEGVWEGVYRYFDAQGNKIDEHQSRLICRFPSTGEFEYHQTNHYTWADGRKESREFPARYANKRILWDNELIIGWAQEVDFDENQRSIMLHWSRKGEPGTYLYEMINTSDDCKHRSRVWQWIENGKVKMRTLIDEVKVQDHTNGL